MVYRFGSLSPHSNRIFIFFFFIISLFHPSYSVAEFIGNFVLALLRISFLLQWIWNIINQSQVLMLGFFLRRKRWEIPAEQNTLPWNYSFITQLSPLTIYVCTNKNFVCVILRHVHVYLFLHTPEQQTIFACLDVQTGPIKRKRKRWQNWKCLWNLVRQSQNVPGNDKPAYFPMWLKLY